MLSHYLRLFAAFLLGLEPAFGYLGSFETADGYQGNGLQPMRDVSGYNAGQFNSSNGGLGGSFSNITPNAGLFYKFDVGEVTEDHLGELIAHPGIARSGSSSLVLRTGSSNTSSPEYYGDSGGDGADYLYHFDTYDYDLADPSAVSSGILTLDYYYCPQVPFFSLGQISTTEFVNSLGETVFAIGTRGQLDSFGNAMFTAQPIITWQDATGWHDTNIVGNNADWDRVTLSFDLDQDRVSFNYFSTLDGNSHTLAFNVNTASNLDRLSGIRFTAQPGTTKNSYDDFDLQGSFSVVPEPGSAVCLLSAGVLFSLRRRRLLLK
jgi:hypothetical protein